MISYSYTIYTVYVYYYILLHHSDTTYCIALLMGAFSFPAVTTQGC